MHWLMKAILFTLSLFLFLGCNDSTFREHKKESQTVSDSTLIYQFVDRLGSFHDDPAVLDSIGNQLSENFNYMPLNREYEEGSILISAQHEESFRHFKNALTTSNMECRTFGAYQVCTGNFANGFGLRCSIRPHPSLQWVLLVEAAN